MEHHILWHPESGTCSACGKDSEKVRRFTSRAVHSVYCFPCWMIFVELAFMTSAEWHDDENVVFESALLAACPS